MPISSSELKDWIADKYRDIDPFHVVDMGPGAGTYAKLLRQTNDSVWTGVEIWEPYVTKYGLTKLYDHLEIADIRDFDCNVPIDLVIFGDVLEHLNEFDCRRTIDSAKKYAENIIVSIPHGLYPQGPVDGNPHETHLCTWSYEGMLDALKPGVIDSAKGRRIAVYHWKKS